MERTLLILGLLIGLNFTLLAQDINLSKSELNSVLCKQWKIEYDLMGGMKIRQIPGAADFDFKFITVGKYKLIRKNGNNGSGIWTFDTEKKYVELSIKGKITSRIKSIDKNTLILTIVS
jgi:hypothetical protein